MGRLPDDALVVRGGQSVRRIIAQASGVTVDPGGRVQGVSVNSTAGLSLKELTAPLRLLQAFRTTG